MSFLYNIFFQTSENSDNVREEELIETSNSNTEEEVEIIDESDDPDYIDEVEEKAKQLDLLSEQINRLQIRFTEMAERMDKVETKYEQYLEILTEFTDDEHIFNGLKLMTNEQLKKATTKGDLEEYSYMPDNKNKYCAALLTTLYRKYNNKEEVEDDKSPNNFAYFVINHSSLKLTVKKYFHENKKFVIRELKLYYINAE